MDLLVLKINVQTSSKVSKEAQIQWKLQSAYLCLEVQVPQQSPSLLLILAKVRALNMSIFTTSTLLWDLLRKNGGQHLPSVSWWGKSQRTLLRERRHWQGRGPDHHWLCEPQRKRKFFSDHQVKTISSAHGPSYPTPSPRQVPPSDSLHLSIHSVICASSIYWELLYAHHQRMNRWPDRHCP